MKAIYHHGTLVAEPTLSGRPEGWPKDAPYIDERVRRVGVSALRSMNGTALKEIGEIVYVIQVDEKPVAVICSYEAFMVLQGQRESAGEKR